MRRWTTLAVVLAALGALAGCGSSRPSSPTRTQARTTAATSSGEAATTQATTHTGFLSPLKDISCELHLEESGSRAEAYCQTTRPERSVTMSEAGESKECSGSGCVGNPAEGEPVLAYGNSVTLGPFHCISERASLAQSGSSMTCTVANGRGFRISPASTSVLGTPSEKGAQPYTACVESAGAEASEIERCASRLDGEACRMLLSMEEGSVSCSAALTVAAIAVNMQSVEPAMIKGFQCYAGAAKTTCKRGSISFSSSLP